MINLSILCALIIIFIWSVGPYLAIGRIIATLIVVITYIMSVTLAFLKNTTEKFSDINPFNSIIDQLRQQTKIAFDAIKKRRQPWILLLGGSHAGKTTLLANCDLTLHSPHQQNLSNISNNPTIDWWVGEQIVFIDPAGKYCLSQESSHDEKYWQAFLNIIKRKHQHQLFDQVMLVMDSPSLISAGHDVDIFIEKVNYQLRTLAAFHRVLPITIVITQCDRLAGFLEFFTDLGPEERNQSLGFTLTSNPENLSTLALFQQYATAFIKRLSDRLIWRLHHEQNLTRRSRIKDFPWQMEKLTQSLEKLLTTLPLDFSLPIQGVYFTSSVQSGNALNALTQSIANTFHLVDIKTISQPTRHKPYFIQALFQQLLTDSPTHFVKIPSSRLRFVSYPIAVIVVVASLFAWHQTYRNNIIALNIIPSRMTNPSTEAPWLSQLNTLQLTLTALDQNSIERDRWLGFGQLVKLRNQLQTIYQQLLTTNFVLYLDQLLTKQIQNDINNNHPDLYNTLQVYLMLIQPDHLNTTEIITWFKALWANQYANNSVEQQLLLQHLNYLLQSPLNAWPVNEDLINHAQQVLQQRPSAQIAFMMLQSLYPQNNQLLLTHQTIPGFDLSHAKISALYSADNFATIYHIQIPQIAAQIERGNWVMGRAHADVINDTSIALLTEKIRTLYLQNYIAAWQSALNQIQLIPPKQFSDAKHDIKILTDQHAALWQVLQKALDNPVIQNHINDENLNATSLLDLISFIHQNDNYQQMQTRLQTLNAYIQPMTDSPTLVKAYDNAVKRLQPNTHSDPLTDTLQLAQKLPAPVNQWLQTLGVGIWQTMLDNAHDYINNLWTNNVIPEYQDHIMNHYPIFKDGQQDISLNNFNHFFGPGGTVETFFNSYLKPFVNTNQVYWTWKKLDGKALAIPQAKLDMLIRASMIQKMFYMDNPDSPTIKFSLTPISLSSNISHFILNIGGQLIDYEPDIKKTTHVTWPGNDGAFVTLRFISLNPSRPTTTMSGFWAWLHLLDQSQLQTTNDPKIFQATFTLDGDRAVYQLVADNPVNPYQPQLLISFRCPDSL